MKLFTCIFLNSLIMRILNLIWALLLMTHVTVAAKVIKVACVGNSITYGANIGNIQLITLV